jgi:hypothetical protein
MANPTYHRNFAPQHSKKMVAPRICNTFAMGNIDKESDVKMEEVIDENNPWLYQFQKELQEAADEEIL